MGFFIFIMPYKMPCQSGSTFAKFSFIALGQVGSPPCNRVEIRLILDYIFYYD